MKHETPIFYSDWDYLPVQFRACTQADETPQTQAGSQSQSELVLRHANAFEANQILAANSDIVVLDVRTPQEYDSGHIEGAVNIDFKNSNFAAKLSELGRNTEYVIHCRSGGRSTKSLDAIEELGFTNITHLDGGIIAWNKADLPLVQ